MRPVVTRPGVGLTRSVPTAGDWALAAETTASTEAGGLEGSTTSTSSADPGPQDVKATAKAAARRERDEAKEARQRQREEAARARREAKEAARRARDEAKEAKLRERVEAKEARLRDRAPSAAEPGTTSEDTSAETAREAKQRARAERVAAREAAAKARAARVAEAAAARAAARVDSQLAEQHAPEVMIVHDPTSVPASEVDDAVTRSEDSTPEAGDSTPEAGDTPPQDEESAPQPEEPTAREARVAARGAQRRDGSRRSADEERIRARAASLVPDSTDEAVDTQSAERAGEHKETARSARQRAKETARRERAEAKEASRNERQARRADKQDRIVEPPREPKKSFLERRREGSVDAGRSAGSKRAISVLAGLIGALGLICSFLLAVGALVVALGTGEGSSAYDTLSSACDVLVGPLRDAVSFSGTDAEVKESLVAWGAGSIAYLVVGVSAQWFLRSRIDD
ncbi:hypothetical protein [Aeromicrobium chenweiae]|uniref:Uncharacterized protein n=1 Tax=Aeromicrobium chenweiae TaxID=2079793 RepID=A0A2S0WNH9_9ACTN|nr:hypothetical protein [Aeromicrobium chenweiae]AWB92903.1 hypothetical protein C3E78_12195 [Aeromicrobium chenweiae]TGN33897.1 hypothetical protein E4L97_02245 [Aeromicrobium chenweiae]